MGGREMAASTTTNHHVMSAYLASSDCISALVTYWESRCSRPGSYNAETNLCRAYEQFFKSLGRDYHQACLEGQAMVADKLKTRTPAQLAFQTLLVQNQMSLEARYPGDKDMQDAEGYAFRRSGKILQLGKNSGLVVGLLNGYEYQACEDDAWETSPAYFICQQIKSMLLSDLEAGLSQEERGWASYEEPEDAPKVVSLAELARR